MLAFWIGGEGAILITELYLGIAVIGWQGERMFLDRSIEDSGALLANNDPPRNRLYWIASSCVFRWHLK